jgi:uncharacterized protein YdaU (DUF1376 family)
MAEFPAMPFWFDAYYIDTDHLTYEEHGLYLKLLSLLWRAPAQRIPADAAWLTRRFKEHTPQVLALVSEFCQRDGNWIRQDRLSREFQYVAEQREKQRVRANLRWGNEKDICHGNATAMPPTPTPKGSKKESLSANTMPVGKEGKRKPRHQQQSNQGRVWFDVGTDEFNAYAQDYWDRHHAPVPLLWGSSGAWFNKLGEG